MGIKGRRKRERERAAKNAASAASNGEDGGIDGGYDEVYADDEEDEEGVSGGSSKLSNTELWRQGEMEYLERMKEQHENRRTSHLSGATHGKGAGHNDPVKRRRRETAEEVTEKVTLASTLAKGTSSNSSTNKDDGDEEENENGTDEDAADHKKKKSASSRISSRSSTAIRGAPVDHILLDLRPELVKALQKEGFRRLTRIQERAIPLALQGFDILGQAKTGSGKTLAFCTPLLNLCIKILSSGGERAKQKHSLLGLLLAPTKELAVQTDHVVNGVTRHLNTREAGFDIRSALITGGTKVNVERRMLTTGAHIVVGTPGRILDHLRHCAEWKTDTLRYLVLDEADRMLAEGFQRDLDAILSLVPTVTRQTFLFSATNSKSVRELARLSLTHTPLVVNTSDEAPALVNQDSAIVAPPRYILFGGDDEEAAGSSSDNDNDADDSATPVPTDDLESIPSTLQQLYYIGEVKDRLRALYAFCKKVAKTHKTMVFCSTVASTTFHCQMMGSVGFHDDVLMLHGHMKHRQRLQAFEAFNEWETGILFCTDVAARGLDIPQVDWILQFDPPLDPTEYIHRIGRTARAGKAGNALIFLTEDEASFLPYLGRFGIKMKEMQMTTNNHLPNIQQKLEHVLQLDSVVAKSAVSAYRAHVGAYQSHLLQETFNIHRIDLDDLATAFALTSAPSVSLPSNTSQTEYVKGKLNSLNKRKKEAVRAYQQDKTKPQWTPDGQFIGARKQAF